MRIIQNEKYIKRRAQIGRYAFFAGLGVLLIGLVISLNPQQNELLGVSTLCLIAGTILSYVGGRYVRRYDRGDLPHIALTRALKGFDDRYVLAHYATPASHVLLTPDAVYVLIAKLQAGRISYQNGRWRNPMGLRRIFTWMSEEGLGNPTRDAAAEVARLQRYLARHLADTPIEVQPVVVFLHPRADADASASPIPAVHVKKLKDWLRARPKGNLAREDRAALGRLLEPATAS